MSVRKRLYSALYSAVSSADPLKGRNAQERRNDALLVLATGLDEILNGLEPKEVKYSVPECEIFCVCCGRKFTQAVEVDVFQVRCIDCRCQERKTPYQGFEMFLHALPFGES